MNWQLPTRLFFFDSFYIQKYLVRLFDVGVFQPFQHYYMKAIGKDVRLEDEKFGKLEFLSAF